MSTKTLPKINAAKKLLEKAGYTVTMNRPDPRIGDVVRFKSSDSTYEDMLITFHQLDPATADDVYDFGGVIVSEKRYADIYTEPCWIDRDEWAKDDGTYEVIGHVNLDKWIKR